MRREPAGFARPAKITNELCDFYLHSLPWEGEEYYFNKLLRRSKLAKGDLYKINRYYKNHDIFTNEDWLNHCHEKYDTQSI